MHHAGILIISWFCGVLLMAEGHAGTLPTVTLQLPWYVSVEFAGVLIAKERGLDTKHGVDLVIREYQPGINAVTSVLSGVADMSAIDAASLIQRRTQGDKVVAVWAQMQVSPLGVCTLRSSNIRTVQDLKGRTFGIQKDYAYLLELFLSSANLMTKDVRVVDIVGDPIIPLEQGLVDAVGCFDTYQPAILTLRGYDPVIIRTTDMGLDFYEQVLFVAETTLQRRPDDLRKAIAAIAEAWRYALQHPEEAVALVIRKYKPFAENGSLLRTPKEYHTHQKVALQLVRWYMTRGVGMKLGLMRRARWAHTIQALSDIGYIDDPSITPEELFTMELFR